MLQIRINDTAHDIPTDLSEIPLGRFIDFYNQYGIELDKKLKAILEKDYSDDFLQSLDLSSHEDEEALCWFSFWTKEDLTSILSEEATPLLTLYRSIKILLHNSEKATYELPVDIEWKEEIWQIQDYKVNPRSKFIFNELLVTKEAMRQIHALGNGKWQALPYLCAVFFRKKGEGFSDELIMEGSERMELMLTLPLEHALKVSFFLSVSINIYRKISQSLKGVAEQAMLT